MPLSRVLLRGLMSWLRSGVTNCARVATVATALIAIDGIRANAVAQTLQQALTQTYRTNPQLDAARATQRATDEEVARAHATFRPQVGAIASASVTRTDTSPSAAADGIGHPRSMGVSAAQPLFRGFRSVNQVRVAEATVRAGREALRSVEQGVLLLATTAYIDIIRDEAIVRLRESNTNVLRNQLKATRDQFALKEVTQTDVAQAEGRYALAIGELEVARSFLTGSRATYERLVGSPPGRLSEPGEPVRLLPRSLQEALKIAVDENPFVGNALYLEMAARFAVDQIRGELLPTVTLNAAYARTYDPSRTMDRSDDGRISANMAVPLYTGGEVEARVRQAKHTHVSRIQQIHQARTEQEALVTQAWSSYIAAKARGEAAARQVQANVRAVAGVREEYRVGQRTLLDVLNAEQELLGGQVSVTSAKRDIVFQAYTLLQTIGRLDAQNLALGGEYYDAQLNYLEVRRKWFGLSITHADGRKEHHDASAPARSAPQGGR